MFRRFFAPRFEEVNVSTLADAMFVRHLAGDLARAAGFSPERLEDARLVASELAHNHVAHHTLDGKIMLSLVPVAEASVLYICSMDNGPGIRDIKRAVSGQNAMGGGLGAGLGTIKRLSDRMDICSSADSDAPCPGSRFTPPCATIISAMIFPDSAGLPGLEQMGLDFWAVSRPLYPHEPCGDGVSLQYDDRYIRLVVTDGEGHGAEAMKASQSIIEEIGRWQLLWPLDDIINNLSGCMWETRGVALCVVLIDRYTGMVQVVCVGSIKILLRPVPYAPDKKTAAEWVEVPCPQKGVLGAQPWWQQTVRTGYGPLNQLDTMIYTDGHAYVSSKHMNELEARDWPSAILGLSLFRSGPDKKDDTTLVVMKWNP